MGAPLMQALPLLMTAGRAVGGMAGRAGAMGGAAGGVSPMTSMFDPTAAKPPMPQMNPMFHDAQPPAKPQGMFGAQPVKDQGIPPRPALASDRIGPGSTHTKTSGPPSNRELGERAGYTTETVQAKTVPRGSSPAPMEDAAPIQAASASAMPKTVADNVKSAGMPMPERRPGMPVPPPGQKPPLPKSSSFFDDSLSMVKGGIGDLQEKLGESSTNPMFQLGMGLLSSGYDGSNPYKNILAGLGGVQPAMMDQYKTDVGIEDRQKEKELADALAAIGLKYTQGEKKDEKPARSRQAAGSARVIRR